MPEMIEPDRGKRKIKVKIFGKDEEWVTIDGQQTVKDMRVLLALDNSMVACNACGGIMKDTDFVNGNMNFVPDITAERINDWQGQVGHRYKP